ncbi:hypothetical protein JD969_04370 [Planctomycetota bacterium]|nr:hypothetical protein JD969_04370 [Planctomycetota bacterium]
MPRKQKALQSITQPEQPNKFKMNKFQDMTAINLGTSATVSIPATLAN